MTPQLTPIHLIGSLGRAIGFNRLDLDVTSIAEAMHAINVITRGKLEQYLSGPGRNRCYRMALQKRTNVIDPQEASHRSGRSAIYIMPTIRGRDSGVGKILTGAAILALAWWNPMSWAYVAGSGLTVAGGIAVGFGTSLVLGGITQLLTPSAKSPEQRGQKDSTGFTGNSSAVTQGGCVPLVYGRALVSPIPVSISVDNEDVPTTDAGIEGVVEIDLLNGGGQQYSAGT